MKSFDKELTAFADQISAKYSTIPLGIHKSSNEKYSIHLFDNNEGLIKGGNRTNAASVSQTTGLIRLFRSNITSREFCFFLILWCSLKNGEKYDDKEIDEAVINYMMLYKFDMVQLYPQILYMLKHADNEQNRKRGEQIGEYWKRESFFKT